MGRCAIADSSLFWDQLLQLIEEERVVPIVGQALLKVRYQGREELLYPLLARLLADYLGVGDKSALPAGDELNTVACRYLAESQDHRIEDLYSALKTIFPRDDELELPAPLLQLAAIKSFQLFVTTTFDPLLVRALDRERFEGRAMTRVFAYSPEDVKDLPLEFERLDRPAVYHLLGKISAIPDYAVTQEDTLEFLHALQSEHRQPKLLFDELNRHSLLVVGSCFGGWLARFFLRTPKRQRLLVARGLTDYVADARVCCDEDLVLFLSHFSRHTKVYETRDAADFVAELHERWSERPQVTPKPPPAYPGAVFLSYASEDREAVAKIKDTLEAEGIDVFFDKDDLKAGEEFQIKLERSISDCSLFMPVISGRTLTGRRRAFRLEWNKAFEEQKKAAPSKRFLVPVVIDGTSPSEPTIPEEFRRIQWESAPDGEMRREFVTEILQLFRDYHQTKAVWV